MGVASRHLSNVTFWSHPERKYNDWNMGARSGPTRTTTAFFNICHGFPLLTFHQLTFSPRFLGHLELLQFPRFTRSVWPILADQFRFLLILSRRPFWDSLAARLRWGVFSLKNGGLPVSSLVNGKMVLKHVPCDGKVELWSS